MSKSARSQTKPCFATISECRICAAVITSREGIKRHGQVCRLKDEIKLLRPHIRKMNTVKFPCPIVALKRFRFDRDAKSRGNNTTILSPNAKLGIPKRSSPRKSERNLRSSKQLRQQDTVKVEPSAKYEDEAIFANEGERESTGSESNDDGLTQMENDHRPPTVTGYLNVTRRYSCPLKKCTTTHISPYKLKRHFIRHLKNNPYSCPVPKCKVVCDSLRSVQLHINLHLGRGKVISCEKCGKVYSKQSNLRKHVCKRPNQDGRIPNVPPRLLQCSVDDMIEFINSSKGVLCRTAKEKAKNISKDPLGLRISELYGRINVDAIIENDPVFIKACKEQPKFKEIILKRSLLKRRQQKMQPSRNERLQCGQCEKTFPNVKHYDEHQLQEHTPRPFKCKICKRDFHKEIYLRKHLKLFECRLDKKYMKRLKSGMWTCKKCGHEVTSTDLIRPHWKNAHKIRIPSHRKSDLIKSTSIYAEEFPNMDECIVKIESEPPVEMAITVIESAVEELNTMSLKVKRCNGDDNDMSDSYQDFNEHGIPEELGYLDNCKVQDED